MQYIAQDDRDGPVAQDNEEKEEYEQEHGAYAEHRVHDADEYLEFQSSYESQEDDASVSRDERRADRQAEKEWTSSSSSSYKNQRGRHAHPRQEDRYDEHGGERNSSAGAAAKDAQAFLRKQTEQAYDFAKKISMEDAKKGASETAKKAKKWGGSLLSSISASISSAAGAVKV